MPFNDKWIAEAPDFAADLSAWKRWGAASAMISQDPPGGPKLRGRRPNGLTGYADYIRASGAGALEISLNALAPKMEFGADGQPLPHRPPPIKLQPGEVARLLQPYVSLRFMDQLRAVVPLALYLALFQNLILRQVVENAWLITGGIFAVIVGLMTSWKA